MVVGAISDPRIKQSDSLSSSRPWLNELLEQSDVRLFNRESFAKLWAIQLRAGNLPRSKELLVQWLNQAVAEIDVAVSRQVNVLIGHPRFQKLEGLWRGLNYLVNQIPESQSEADGVVKVRILNVSWQVLVRDLDKSLEFDLSQLFSKVYNEEFGISGGEPFSVLLGDYEIRLGTSPGCPIDDIDALARISEVAAAAFSPFITAAHPSLLGLESFDELERPQDLQRIFDQPELFKWRSIRQREDSRFIGITLPRILLRPPHQDDGSLRSNFRFTHVGRAGSHDGHLWGNSAFAYGAILIQAFLQSGWLSEIRGVRKDYQTGGLVCGLPSPSFETDHRGLVLKGSLEVMIPDILEPEIAEQGFLSLCRCQDTEYSAFYSGCSIQRPKIYDDVLATANARIGSQLPYILCVSRFSHGIKVLGRDKIGSFSEPEDMAKFLNRWILQYVSTSTELSAVERAKFPLRNAKVEVREMQGKPGVYSCSVYMEPYLQFDKVAAGIRLTTELAKVSK